jgi:hypothetical protein
MKFTTITHHGDYYHQATTDVPDNMPLIEAWERVQRLSPYTGQVSYDETNASHRECLHNFAMLRAGNAKDFDGNATDKIPGWSWTWIKRESPVMYETTITFKVLSDELIPETFSPEEIYEDAMTGNSVLATWVRSDTELSSQQMAKALIESGSDPAFFGLDDEGNDIGFTEAAIK